MTDDGGCWLVGWLVSLVVPPFVISVTTRLLVGWLNFDWLVLSLMIEWSGSLLFFLLIGLIVG